MPGSGLVRWMLALWLVLPCAAADTGPTLIEASRSVSRGASGFALTANAIPSVAGLTNPGDAVAPALDAARYGVAVASYTWDDVRGSPWLDNLLDPSGNLALPVQRPLQARDELSGAAPVHDDDGALDAIFEDAAISWWNENVRGHGWDATVILPPVPAIERRAERPRSPLPPMEGAGRAAATGPGEPVDMFMQASCRARADAPCHRGRGDS